ncbi:ABC transporter ATP-binding protein [Amaricoccus sp. W119]|uniref:ABC transporter ATP-binding protein n=1 Tax=Amaricoccus sp. W119 TaxID=3391833 RepID=UPI0039A4A733
MPGLHINNVSKSFGAVQVLRDIELSIGKGEFLVLLGESGCGKSTLLRLISGLELEHEGAIRIAGRDVTHLDPKDRDIAMVFQSYALYPHMSVFDNIAFGMRIRKTGRDAIKAEVDRVAAILKLDQHLDRKPGQLSGGQRQRVAIGRAMVRHPALFLFDEPLSNLDAKLRAEMRTEFKRIHKVLGATIAYVTHDQIEAMTLADKIVLLNGGRIEQLGTPDQLYSQPDTLFAARFIGTPEINALRVRVEPAAGGYAARASGRVLPLPASVARRPITAPREAILGVRPEFLTIGATEAGIVTSGHVVELCEPMGSETSVELSFSDQSLRLRVPGLHHLETGGEQSITWDFSNAHLFDTDTGAHL